MVFVVPLLLVLAVLGPCGVLAHTIYVASGEYVSTAITSATLVPGAPLVVEVSNDAWLGHNSLIYLSQDWASLEIRGAGGALADVSVTDLSLCSNVAAIRGMTGLHIEDPVGGAGRSVVVRDLRIRGCDILSTRRVESIASTDGLRGGPALQLRAFRNTTVDNVHGVGLGARSSAAFLSVGDTASWGFPAPSLSTLTRISCTDCFSHSPNAGGGPGVEVITRNVAGQVDVHVRDAHFVRNYVNRTYSYGGALTIRGISADGFVGLRTALVENVVCEDVHILQAGAGACLYVSVGHYGLRNVTVDGATTQQSGVVRLRSCLRTHPDTGATPFVTDMTIRNAHTGATSNTQAAFFHENCPTTPCSGRCGGVHIDNLNVINCTTTSGTFSSGVSTLLTNALFERNSGTYTAGIYQLGTKPGAEMLTVEDSVFRQNTGETGTAFMLNSFGPTLGYPILINRCLFEDNQADVSGGVIRLSGGDQFAVRNSTFRRNFGSRSGIDIRTANNSVILESLRFEEQDATFTSAVWCEAGVVSANCLAIVNPVSRPFTIAPACTVHGDQLSNSCPAAGAWDLCGGCSANNTCVVDDCGVCRGTGSTCVAPPPSSTTASSGGPSSSSSTATPSGGPSPPSPSAAIGASSQPAGNASVGLFVGVAVGVLMCLLLVAALIVFLRRRAGGGGGGGGGAGAVGSESSAASNGDGPADGVYHTAPGTPASDAGTGGAESPIYNSLGGTPSAVGDSNYQTTDQFESSRETGPYHAI